MTFYEIEFPLAPLSVESVEAALLDVGASSITFVDRGDEPVLEPKPGEVRLWSDTLVRALFQEDWDDFQFSFLGANGLTEIRNAGQARIRGFEADMLWQVSEGFSLSSAFSILDAKSTQNYCGTTYEQIMAASMACRANGFDSMVRMPLTNYAQATQNLEAGAGGLMAARVETVAEAEQFVRWAKFAPRGRRGLNGSGFDAAYGGKSLKEFTADANRDTFVAIQIETLPALHAAEQIAAINGVAEARGRLDILVNNVGARDRRALDAFRLEDFRRLLEVHAEEALEDHHDELHRRVIVVEHQHLVLLGLLGPRAGLGGDADLVVGAPDA